MKNSTIIFALCLWGVCISKNLPAQIQAFYIGHSLTDQVPDMVKSLADDHAQVSFNWVLQSIPGAPLHWQWGRMAADDYTPIPPHYYGFYHPTHGLPNGNFNVLVLTESVPRINESWSIGATYEYTELFAEYATDFNPNTQVYIYEVWHCLESGTPTGCDFDFDSNPWRQRLEDDLPMWESVVDHLNNELQLNQEVCLIPGGQGLARLYDEILLGTVPGISVIADLFSDNIHLTDQGKYFIACIHFAMLTGQNPIGLTHQTQVWWGGDFEAPSPELALRMQEIAWETVTSYPNSCVNQFLSASVISFTTIPSDHSVLLHAKIDCDDSCKYFFWQHSTDGVHFKDLQQINYAPTVHSVLDFEHLQPTKGVNYYRLKFADINGDLSYSSIRAVHFNNSKTKIFPNPTHDYLYLQGVDNNSSCIIMSLDGQMEIFDTSSPIFLGHKAPGLYICKVGNHSISFLKL